MNDLEKLAAKIDDILWRNKNKFKIGETMYIRDLIMIEIKRMMENE